jgi:hypothetical protein
MRARDRYKPILKKQSDGSWHAIAANEKDETIIGHGYCPAEALDDFDKWYGDNPPKPPIVELSSYSRFSNRDIEDIYNYIKENSPCSSPEIANALKVSTWSVSNRIKKLVNAGLVSKKSLRHNSYPHVYYINNGGESHNDGNDGVDNASKAGRKGRINR